MIRENLTVKVNFVCVEATYSDVPKYVLRHQKYVWRH